MRAKHAREIRAGITWAKRIQLTPLVRSPDGRLNELKVELEVGRLKRYGGESGLQLESMRRHLLRHAPVGPITTFHFGPRFGGFGDGLIGPWWQRPATEDFGPWVEERTP